MIFKIILFIINFLIIKKMITKILAIIILKKSIKKFNNVFNFVGKIVLS